MFSNSYFLTDILSEDRVFINLLLTKFCNFSCERCFFWSSPQQPTKYMGDDVLSAINKNMEIVDYLYEKLEYCQIPRFNAIGGEPLVNIKKFDQIIEKWFIGNWLNKYEFEMTTNGYWLEFPKLIPKVLDIFTKIQDSYAFYEDDFIRVSTSLWHDSFYKRLPSGINGYTYLRLIIDDIQEGRMCSCGEEVFYHDPSCNYCVDCGYEVDEEFYCYNCDKIVDFEEGEDDEWCPNCGFNYDLVEWPSDLIYVETYSKDYVPTGGGANVSGHKRYDHTCYSNSLHNILSFDPNGDVVDGCCSGGGLLYGNIKFTSIMHLFVLQKLFFNEHKSITCSECNQQSSVFVESYQEEIDKFCSEPLIILHEDVEITIMPNGDFTVTERDKYKSVDLEEYKQVIGMA